MANPETSSSQPDKKKYMSVKFPDDPETTAVLKELDRVVLNCANDGADKLKIPPKDANRRSPPLPRDPKDVDPEEVEIVMNQSGCSRVAVWILIQTLIFFYQEICGEFEIRVVRQQTNVSRHWAILAMMACKNINDAIISLDSINWKNRKKLKLEIDT